MRIPGIGRTHGSSTKAADGPTETPQSRTHTLPRPSGLGSAPPQVQPEGGQASANLAPRRKFALGGFKLVGHRPGKPTAKPQPDETPKGTSRLPKLSNWLPFKLKPSNGQVLAQALEQRDSLGSFTLERLEAVKQVQALEQAAAVSKTKPINTLPSAPKIDLTKTPDAHLDALPPEQLKWLAKAFGAGMLKDTDAVTYVKRQLEKIKYDRFGEIDWKKDLQSKQLWAELPPYKQERLEKAASIAHMSINQYQAYDMKTGKKKTFVDVYFGGTMNGRDVGQDLKTAVGGVGEVYKATREIAELIAEAMASNPNLEVDRVLGFSMGGGTAQAFVAGVESRIKPRSKPLLVTFDPQLLNDAQAKHAIKDGPLGYDYGKPRGVAVTLDYEAAPRKGLMNVMKGPARYKSPGLVQLRLGLKDDDGVKHIKQKDPVTGAILKNKKGDVLYKLESTVPTALGPPGLGYHGDPGLFAKALARFTTWSETLTTPSWLQSDAMAPDNQPSTSRSDTFASGSQPSWPRSDTLTPSTSRSNTLTSGSQPSWPRSDTLTPDNQPSSSRSDAVTASDQQLSSRSEIEEMAPIAEGR